MEFGAGFVRRGEETIAKMCSY